MKILIILPFIPYPLDSGGNQAFFSMVDYLKDIHDISVLYPTWSSALGNTRKLEDAWNGRVKVFPVHGHRGGSRTFPYMNTYMKVLSYVNASSQRKMKRWLGRHMDRVAENDGLSRLTSVLYADMPEFSDGFMQYIHDLCERERFDCVQVEFYSHFPFRMLFPADVRTIFVEHEIQFVRIANEMSLFKDLSWNDRVLYERKKNEELAEIATFDRIITLTETDRDILSEYIPSDRIRVSPAVISEAARMPFRKCGREFAFVGGAAHNPNLDAIVWFCRSIVPLLREKGFPFKLYVVGQWEGALARSLSEKCPEVVFTGYVDDLKAFLNGKISIVPVRIGSGMRIKILDAVHSMSPFITTAKGVEGQDFRDMQECLICDTPEAFASAMIRLASDTDLQGRLAAGAVDKLDAMYDRDALLKKRGPTYTKNSRLFPARFSAGIPSTSPAPGYRIIYRTRPYTGMVPVILCITGTFQSM